MSMVTWIGEWIAQPLPIDPPDPQPELLGAATGATRETAGLSVVSERARVEVRFLGDEVVEVKASRPDDLALPSFARAEAPELEPPGSVHVDESPSGWSAVSAAVRVEVARQPLRLETRTGGGISLCDDPALGMAWTRRGWRAHWVLEPGDRIFGLGEKTGALQRRGRRTMMWARDMLVTDRSDPLYASIPFFLLCRGGRWTGVLLDSAARSVFDLGHTAADRLSFGPRDGALVYIVFAGPTLRDVLRQYTDLTGRPPMPPRWALGHHQSRYSYADEGEVREIASEFRRRDIPTDAIHLDIHYMRGFRVFTFHPQRFADTSGLARELAEDGFRLVTIVDPGLKVDRRYEPYREGVERRYFAAHADGRPFVMKVWPREAVFPDFYRAEVRQWWGDLHRVYTEAGIAGIWNDMNEPSGWRGSLYLEDGVLPFGDKDTSDMTHRLDDGSTVPHRAVRNAYGHEECRATREGLSRLRPSQRPFVLTRSAFAGTQCHAALWTGDVLSSWPCLRQTLPMLMGLGLSGMSFAGNDIGGFFGDCTAELYARWVQIGALAPFCRTHTALHSSRQEPWSFGPEVESIARAALKLRYRLLPYLYTCFWEASRTGMPVWRPLFAEFPEDERLLEVDDQVMVGPALLAAPVLEPDATRRKVVLPRGTWFAWHSGEEVEGGGSIEVEAPLAHMPLYVRAGAALAAQEEVRFAGDRPEAPLVWEVFLTPNATGPIGRVYEDDGESFAYRDGDWCLISVQAGRSAGGLELRFGPSRGAYRSPRRMAQVNLHGIAASVVQVDGTPLPSGAAIQLPHDGGLHRVEIGEQSAS